MLGIINLIVGTGILCYGSIKDANSDSKSRQNAIKAGKRDYIDSHGHTRDVINNHKVLYWTDNNYETTRYDLEDGTSRNITRELNMKSDKPLIPVDRGNTHWKDECKGLRYYHKKSGKIVTKRGLQGCCTFYINVETGEIVEYCLKKEEFGEEEYNRRISKIKARQIELIQYGDKFLNRLKC